MSERFNFNISLSVLNHLGRNLYRNVITVIGEAISNSWDADAKNVWIEIDRDNNSMCILDDGIGMDPNDFQNKFLKIGSILFFVVLAAYSCYATEHSLHLLSPHLPVVLVWAITIAFFFVRKTNISYK